MKYNELGAVKACLLSMKFETYGDITRVGDIIAEIDESLNTVQKKLAEVLAAKDIKDGFIDNKHPLFAEVSKAMDDFAATDSGMSAAFMTPEQFDHAIKTREQIPTELLIAGGKYLVKK